MQVIVSTNQSGRSDGGRRQSPGVPPTAKTAGMAALMAMTSIAFAGYSILLPTAPLWATENGANAAGAGLVNAVLMGFTVLTQIFVPVALRRIGWTATLVASAVFLGAPSLLFSFATDLPSILALSALRGIGFGALTVCGATAVGELVEPARRGRAVGAYGLSIAAPQFLFVSSGAFVAEQFSYTTTFILGASPLLAAIPAALLGRVLARRAATAVPTPPQRWTSYLGLTRPVVILAGVTMAGGALITFLPQMTNDPAAVLAGLALLTGVATIARWRFGALADRFGTRAFMWPLVSATVVGLLLVAWAVRDPSATLVVTMLIGMTFVGAAYGGLQNLTLVEAFAVAPTGGNTVASTVWNIGFDVGTGLGALAVGYVAAGTGFPAAMATSAAVAAVTLIAAFSRIRSVAPVAEPVADTPA